MSEFFEIDLDDLFGNMKENGALPDPDTMMYYSLASHRKIFLVEDVSLDIMLLTKMIMRWNMEDAGKPVEERQPIWMYIMNYGGDLDCMWSLVDTVLASDTPIYTVNLGVADSAAAYVFMSGAKRFMLQHSTVLIHEGMAQFIGDAGKIQDNVEAYKNQLDAIYKYVLQQTSIPMKMLNKKRNSDWTLDAETCVKYHVCDKVIQKLSDVL